MRIAFTVVAITILTTALLTAQTGPATGGSPAPATPPAQTSTGRGGRGGRGGPRVIHVPDAPLLPYSAVEHALVVPASVETGVFASVAVNSKGHVFVYQRAAVPLLEFDANGHFIRGLREGTETRAHSLRIDASDNLWLVDSGDHTVTKLSPNGDVLLTLGTKGVSGSGDEAAAKPLFNTPSDVAIAPNGDIFVSQSEGGGPDPRIIHFDATGKFLKTWSLARPDGSRVNPHALVIGHDGLLYVADREAMRIRVFRQDGTPVREMQMPTQMCGLAVDAAGTLWAATGFDGQVMTIAPDGKVLGFAGKAGTGDGEMQEAHMLTVAPNGIVYVTDTLGHKVLEFVRH